MARRRHARKARFTGVLREIPDAHAALDPNPRRRHRRLRRVRRNPTAVQQVYGPSGASFLGETAVAAPASKKPGKRRRARRLTRAQRRRQRTSKRLLTKVRALRKRARKAPRRSLRRSVLNTQAHRLSTLRRVALKGRRVKKSPVYKAMHLKTNPGLAGMMASAKVLLPQAGVGAVSMVGLALAGKKVSDMLAGKLPVAVEPYTPAISTALLSVGGYMLADKFLPKFKGAVAIGGLLAASLQAIAALSKSAQAAGKSDSLSTKALSALGVGDYTTVGGRSYADAGIFRDIGDYTTVGEWSEAREGGAYSTGRPRNYGDNQMEWATNGLDDTTEFARDSIHGLDDTTEFAPGEGGVLSGGLFRGPSSR